MTTAWLIRNDTLDAELEREGFISIGWDMLPDINGIPNDKASLAKLLAEHEPESSLGKLAAAVGTVTRFHRTVSIGDIVVAPYNEGKELRVGTVVSPYYFEHNANSHRHRRRVKWGTLGVRRARLPEDVRNGIRNISTLSRINRGLDLFAELAKGNSEVLAQSEEVAPATTWLVGAVLNGEDRSEEFVREGYWQLSSGLDARTAEMRKGDRIAIKSTFVRKHGLPFENHGKPVACMTVKARGVVTAVLADRVTVNWETNFEERDWFLYTYMPAVWRLNLSSENAKRLARFVFEDEPQDFSYFLGKQFWSRYQQAEPEENNSAKSYRAAGPTPQTVYEAVDRWRSALIEGKSLFGGHHISYQDGIADLISDFIERPDEGSGSFLQKLEAQLERSSDDAVQIASELLYVYFLPMHVSSMGQDAKVGQLEEIATWRTAVAAVPDDLKPALNCGLVRVGTGFQTYRWKIFQYLVRFLEAFVSLSKTQREIALSDWDAFKAVVSQIDDTSVWAMRFMLEHLLFPDHAVAGSSRADRAAIVESFSRDFENLVDVNELKHFLDANIRYGNRHEVALYRAPHVFQWKEPNDVLSRWGAWAGLLLEDVALDDEVPTLGAGDDSQMSVTFELLDSSAARRIRQWSSDNPDAMQRMLDQAKQLGPEYFTDQLAQAVQFQGPAIEMVEAASNIYADTNAEAPRFARSAIPAILSQLSTKGLVPDATPGEYFQTLLEGIEAFSWVLMQRSGVDLTPGSAALLVQTILDLDPGSTSWPRALQTAFLDWRTGRKPVSPDDPAISSGLVSTPERIAEQLGGGEPRQSFSVTVDVPKTIEDLSEALFFTSEDSMEWLRETMDLLDDKRQIILQGPPGTGKTFLARKLAFFLAQHEDRVTTVQFHPATAYEDFVQGLRPNPDAPGEFHLQDGPLLRAARRAALDAPDVPHVLIIDEVNRANLPAVFGELYFLLEYRGDRITLNYGGEFSLPPNLYVIGTMNTSDRSIAAIDAALRRRFVIRDLRPGETPMSDVLKAWLAKSGAKLSWLPELLALANERIQDRDQFVGPSHFLRSDLTEQWARRAWVYTVMPTLEEYFYGQPDRTESLRFGVLKSVVLKTDDDITAE